MTRDNSQSERALTLTLSRRERGFKRRAYKLLLFLLAGAIVNIAVAWGCAIHNTREFLNTGFPCWGEEPFIRDPFPMRSFESAHVIWIDEVYPVPIDPIWPGFAINTIFYTAILYAFFAVPGAVRRRVRRKRGQCAACGYPVGSSAVCSECGTPRNAVHKVAALCNPCPKTS